jgi:hypothetical protein
MLLRNACASKQFPCGLAGVDVCNLSDAQKSARF